MAFNEAILGDLAFQYYNESHSTIDKIPQSGSNRRYFRIRYANRPSIIGVYNMDIKENDAFFQLTELFSREEINVPRLLAVDESRQYYLLNDLGDTTLYSFLTQHRKGETLDEQTIAYYKKVLKALPKIQLAGRKVDFSICYPRHAFDEQSMQWDLNYFKYYFLKLAGIPFDEQLLENDFKTLIHLLLQADDNYFLYRDFQSRNIMIHDEEVFFIDYQGGRKGALQYDIASLLYDGKADIAPEYRDQFLSYYLDELEKQVAINREDFLLYYDAFVLVRIIQALGTYGFRGYYEKKSHFLLSIPYAIRNIRYILENRSFPFHAPMLMQVLSAITKSEELPTLEQHDDRLTVTVTSFSYKKGIPADISPNGGGFVFDCRALPNPGRELPYRSLDGKDAPVIDYLERFEETAHFKQHTFAIIDASIDNYLERRFSRLMVNFGCTGGQHRSVYFAESLSKHIQEKYPMVKIILKHTNRD